MKVITDTGALASLCQRLTADPFITVDTEFMRERTYWPVLCLVQVAGANDEAIIDPLAPGISLQPLFDLMVNEQVLKIFHAGRQDIEIFHHLAGLIPTPLFDTQLAAMVCGFGDQVGYEALVRSLIGESVDKSSRFTDWSKRPLSEKQLSYALSDVTHLRHIHEVLKRQLTASGREPWLSEELAVLTSPATYDSDPNRAWKRIKFKAKNKRQLSVLRALAAWRERTAQAQNVPRGRILKDDALIELTQQTPTRLDTLKALRALPRGYASSHHGDAILAAVREGLEGSTADLPETDGKRRDLPNGAPAIAEILKLALKIVAERDGIAPKLIASSADIELIAAGRYDGVPAMTGWRRGAFGAVALDIKAGNQVIGLLNGRADILPAGGPVTSTEPVK